MPRKQQWVVRVIIHKDEDGTDRVGNETPSVYFGTILESLRYAGLATVHAENDLTKYIFDLHCPHGHDSKVWANMNAERMQSLGINAAAAPRYP